VVHAFSPLSPHPHPHPRPLSLLAAQSSSLLHKQLWKSLPLVRLHSLAASRTRGLSASAAAIREEGGVGRLAGRKSCVCGGVFDLVVREQLCEAAMTRGASGEGGEERGSALPCLSLSVSSSRSLYVRGC
jgi:hypothetical protein